MYQFSAKMDNLTFSELFFPKMNLDFGIQKIKAGRRVSFQKIPCVPKAKWTTLTFLVQICPKMNFRVGISEN